MTKFNIVSKLALCNKGLPSTTSHYKLHLASIMKSTIDTCFHWMCPISIVPKLLLTDLIFKNGQNSRDIFLSVKVCRPTFIWFGRSLWIINFLANCVCRYICIVGGLYSFVYTSSFWLTPWVHLFSLFTWLGGILS